MNGILDQVLIRMGDDGPMFVFILCDQAAEIAAQNGEWYFFKTSGPMLKWVGIG